VAYPLIPGMGFWAYGFAQLAGNSAKALTAVWRMLLDAGMFATFPGFLRAKFGAAKQNTNIRVMPGGSQEIDTGGLPIKDVIMDLPYKEPSAELGRFSEAIAAATEELVGAANVPVGEGKANIPVGTILAMIEQSTKVQGAIHKRNHYAQQRELEKLKKLFSQDPHSLWRFAKNPGERWETGAEFADARLVPASDPNVPSHTHRLMQAVAVAQRADAHPEQYDAMEVEKYILKTIGVSNIGTLLKKPAPPGSEPPVKSPDEIKQETEVIKAEARKGEQLREQAQDQLNQKGKMEQLAMQAAIKREDNRAKQELALLKQADEITRALSKEVDANAKKHVAETKERETTVKSDAQIKTAAEKTKATKEAAKKQAVAKKPKKAKP